MYSPPEHMCISAGNAVNCCLLGTRLAHKLTLMGGFVSLDMFFAAVDVCT